MPNNHQLIGHASGPTPQDPELARMEVVKASWEAKYTFPNSLDPLWDVLIVTITKLAVVFSSHLLGDDFRRRSETAKLAFSGNVSPGLDNDLNSSSFRIPSDHPTHRGRGR